MSVTLRQSWLVTGSTRNWSLSNGQLIEGEIGDTGKLSLATLEGSNWVLTHMYRNKPVAEGAEVTLDFTAEQISGKSACNRYSAGIEQGEVGTYIGMFWNSMGSVMRVAVTLGVGYVLLIVLVSALHENKFPKLILPLTFACVFMMTGGWFVLIHEVDPQLDNWRTTVLFVFGMMALHQGVLFGKYQRTVLAFTALFFVYGFLDVALDLLGVPMAYIAIILGASVFLVGTALEKTPHRVLAEPALLIGVFWLNSGLFDRIAMFASANWASLITGMCVIFAAYGMHKAERYPRLIAVGYFIGSIMAYGGLFDLVQNTSVELLFLAVTASALYACVVLQSRALLLTTVIAMLAFIGYFSEKHFANSLGWPITLVLMGVAFLGIGAIALKVKQRI